MGKILRWLFGLVVVSLMVLMWIEIRWYNLPVIEHHATLENCDFKPSTLHAHATPIFSSKGGMHMAITTTGHDEIYTTVWNCGKYGRVVCDEQEVYRWAQPESTLYIKVWDTRVRIVGIKHEG